MLRSDHERRIVVAPPPSDYCDEYRRIPWYILACVVAYVAIHATDPEWSTEESHAYRGLILDTDAPKAQVYRLYSSSLLHADWAHLTNNSLFLLIVGSMLNAVHGNVRVFLLHSLGILMGALAVFWESVIRGGARVLVVGASGGVYCLVGAHGGNVLINFSEMPFAFYRIALLSAYVFVDVLMYFLAYQKMVSYSGHLGGFLAGLFASPVMLRNLRVLPWERKAISTTLALVSFVLGASASMVAFRVPREIA
jgi:membrane associated rhomboid family serine protease